MGNNSPAPISTEISNRFELIRRLQSQSLFLLEEISTHRQYLMRELRYSNTGEFLQAVGHLQYKKNSVGSPYVTPLKEYITKAEDEYCVSHHKVFALFEYPHHNLEQEIVERSSQRRRFSEKEVWAILASCIHGLAHLEKTGVSHECLKSDQILLENDGSIKVADPFCCSVGLNYQLIYDNLNTSHIYPSPEIIHAIQQGHTLLPRSINQYRSDVFTVGMIMLQVCLLQQQDDCYLVNKRNINWQKVQLSLQKLSEKYSLELRQTIELMIKRQFKERPDWIEMEFTFNKNRSSVSAEDSRMKSNIPGQQITVESGIIKQQYPSKVVKQQPVGALPGQIYQGGNPPPQQPHVIRIVQQLPNKHLINLPSQNNADMGTTQATTNVQRPPDSLTHTTPAVPMIKIDANLIVPVQTSNWIASRPSIDLKVSRPADNYVTRTKIDENLVEILDDSNKDKNSATKINQSGVKPNTNYMQTFPATDLSTVMFSGNSYTTGLPKNITNNNMYTPFGTSNNNFMQGLNIANNQSNTGNSGNSYMMGSQKGGTAQLNSFGNIGAGNINMPGVKTTTSYSSNNIGSSAFTFAPSTISNDIGTSAFKSNFNTQDIGYPSSNLTNFTSGNFSAGNGTTNYPNTMGATGKMIGGLQNSMSLGMGMPSTGLSGASPFGLTNFSGNSSNYGVTSNNRNNLGIGTGSISTSISGFGPSNIGLGNKGLSSFNTGNGKFDASSFSVNSATTGLSGMGTSMNNFGFNDTGKFNFGNPLGNFTSPYTDIQTTTTTINTNNLGNQFGTSIGSNRPPLQTSFNNDFSSRSGNQERPIESLFTDMSTFGSANAVHSQSQDKYSDPFKFKNQFTTKAQTNRPQLGSSPRDMNKKTYMSPSAVTTNVTLEKKHPVSPVMEMLKGFDSGRQSPSKHLSDPISQSNLQISITPPPSQVSNFSFNNLNQQSAPIEPPRLEAPQSFNVNTPSHNTNFPSAAKGDDIMYTDYSKFGIVRGGGGGGGLNNQSKNGSASMSLQKKPTLVASLATPADALNLLNSAQLSSKNSFETNKPVDKTGSINLGDSSRVDSYPSSPVVMSFDAITRHPSRSAVENVGTMKPLDTITQASVNEQANKQQLQRPQGTFQVVPVPRDEKINIVDHDDVRRVQALKFPQAQPTLVQSQEIKSFDNVLSQKSDGPKFVIETFKQGSRYEGQKLNEMRHGKGKFFYQDGGLYDGNWKQNHMDGLGKLYYQSGKLAYDGEWKDDQFCGHGILYNEQPQEFNESLNFENFEDIEEYWTKFEGEFKDDLKEGRGTLHFTTGEYFKGIFNKDAISGPGEFHSRDGSIAKGVWDNNRLVRLEN